MIDLNSLRLAHRRFLSAHDSAVQRSLNEAREAGIEEVQKRPPFKPQTGELQAATTGQIIRTARGSIVRLQNRKPYAAAIDKGARPHPIEARRAKALRFTSSSGALVFRRRVNHPGNRPYHFLRTATTAAAHNFELRMAPRMRDIARKF